MPAAPEPLHFPYSWLEDLEPPLTEQDTRPCFAVVTLPGTVVKVTMGRRVLWVGLRLEVNEPEEAAQVERWALAGQRVLVTLASEVE